MGCGFIRITKSLPFRHEYNCALVGKVGKKIGT